MDLELILTRSLGLSVKEAGAYLALLELGPSTVKPIAEQARLKRTSVYNFIDGLVEQEIVSKTVIRGRTYYEAASPHKLLELARERLSTLEGCIPEFEKRQHEIQGKIKVNYFTGAEEVKNIVRKEVRCKKEALYIWPGKETIEAIGGAKHMLQIDKERIANGVHIRTIRFRQKDSVFETSAHGKKFLRTLRFAPHYFSSSIAMAIYDTDEVAFFGSKKEGFGVVIQSKELSTLMRSFYETLWKDCIPAREGEG